MSKHTPAPWTIGKDGFNACMIYGAGHGVCQIFGLPMNTDIETITNEPIYSFDLANARLISAAPDMAEALQDILSSLEVVWSKGFAAREDLDAEIKFARAALKKAGVIDHTGAE